MAEDPPIPSFMEIKDGVLENLEAIRHALMACIDEGMMDLEDRLNGEVLALMEELDILTGWDEMEELIIRAQAVEHDIDAWLSMHGRTSIALSWPHR